MTDTSTDNGTCIIVDGLYGPELWRRTETGVETLLSKEGLRIAMWKDMGSPYGNAYLADVDKVWSAIADAVERGRL